MGGSVANQLLRFAACLGAWAALGAAGQPERVTLQLKWQHQFQFAGYYAAQAKGYYRQAGLDVTLIQATPSTDPVHEVTSGRAQYGISNSALLLARQQGQPVVVLAAVFQHSPLVLIARPEAGIRSIQDLAGKRIMLEAHSDELLAYLRMEKIAESSLHWLPHTFEPTDLIQGRTDVISAYSTDEPYFLDRAGFRYVVLDPRSAGIDFYGDNLFTSATELKAHPARVQAFREASMKGWQYALSHPDELADLILERYSPRHGREYLLYEARQMAPLIHTDLVDIGYMYPGRWQHIADTYADLGLLPRGFPLQGFLYEPPTGDPVLLRRLSLGLLFGVAAGGLLAALVLGVSRLNRKLKAEIAAHRLADADLEDKERRFRFIAEHTGDVIWQMDLASGRFTYISPSVTALRGYTPEEVMAMPVSAALTEESAVRMQATLAEAISAWHAGHHAIQRITEVDQPHRDGRIIPTEVVTTLHGDAQGHLVSILGVTRDITRRRQDDLDLRNAMRELEQLAGTDALTGAWNRRQFDEAVARETHRASRYHEPVCVLLLDLDHFKAVNDTHGHAEGDRVLRQVAECIRGVIRLNDSLTRWGGEEFVVLMPNTTEAQAVILAERIRETTAAHDFQGLPPVTVSIGVAEHAEGELSAAWLQRADRAMYQAKREGRNCVRVDRAQGSASGAEPQERTFLKLVWSPAYSSGNALIDSQHEALFRVANGLLDGVLSSRPKEEVADLLAHLLAEVVQHFQDEERILAEAGFPGCARHAELHADLAAQAGELAKAFDQGALPLGALVQFLAQDVVAMHMLKADRDFFPYTGAPETP
jgi:diguanylate cyclase (GGDEF)-like protein/hemerythrin-like metal-binding protein/PAS domain S-box-containing protein